MTVANMEPDLKDAASSGKSSGSSATRFLPLAILLSGLGAFFLLDLDAAMTLDALRDNRRELLDFVAEWPVWSAVVVGLLYAIVIAFSLPVGLVMTVAAGFMLGSWVGTIVVVVGATVGAVAVFLAARSAVGGALRDRAGPFLKKVEAGFNEDAMSYLLVLRLIPLFPFWLVNIVPAMLNVSLRTYIIATLLGIIPATFAFADFGNGLGKVFEMGGDPDLSMILSWEVVRPLILLSLVSLLPVAYRKWKSRQSPDPAADQVANKASSE